MDRSRLASAGAVALAITLACSVSSTKEARTAGELTVDAIAYTPTATGERESFTIRATYRNTGDAPLYIYRACGPLLAFSLVREPGDTTRVGLGPSGACILPPMQPPVAVQPSETFSDELRVYSGDLTTPLAERTGRFNLVLYVQSTNRAEPSGPVDLIPLSMRTSPAFRVNAR